MATEITLNNSDELQEMIDRKDFTIAKAIIKSILNNINTRKKHVHVLSVNCIDDNAVYDVTLEKRYFVETLQENLKYYIEEELYEECSQIVNAINQLTEKEHGIKEPEPIKTRKTKTKTSGDSLEEKN
jgi:protein-arginine kinase activator protein McsA